jgi:uncharacterized protein (DUF2062 family)
VTGGDAIEASHEAGLGGGLLRRVLARLRAQLARGASPEDLALSLGIGVTLGLFPVLGATTVLCLVVGLALRLNHPALQVANYLVAALQLPLIYPFVRLGERLVGSEPASFSIPELLAAFEASPAGFLARWGLTGLHGVLGWALVAPFLAWMLYAVLLPLLRALDGRSRPDDLGAAAKA